MTALAGHEEEWIDSIPADRLKRLIDSGVKIFLVDLCPAKSFSSTECPGAPSIPSAELASRFNEIPKTVRVVLYCAVKKASLPIRRYFLKSQGYRNISVMREENPEWVKRGYPVETKSPVIALDLLSHELLPAQPLPAFRRFRSAGGSLSR
jgi:rhodanese-related sulfurtransferase